MQEVREKGRPLRREVVFWEARDWKVMHSVWTSQTVVPRRLPSVVFLWMTYWHCASPVSKSNRLFRGDEVNNDIYELTLLPPPPPLLVVPGRSSVFSLGWGALLLNEPR